MKKNKKIEQQLLALQETNRLMQNQILQLEKSVKKSENAINEENTISFQLGKIIIDSFGSLSGFIFMPKNLFLLYQESKRRKNKELLAQPKPITFEGNIKTSNVDSDGLFQGLTLFDPISEICWKDAFNGFALVRKDYQKQISTTKSQFAFFESAWNANKGSWIYAFTSPKLQHSNAQALLDAISLLKKKGIPIIFWNKEDPMHYEMFKPIAALADYVFTTDEQIIGRYKNELNTDKVWALPFAAPIKKTNPINRFSLPKETVCFAGTYYSENHPDRKKQMDMLLPALLESEGVIYDRASKDTSGRYAYPDKYKNIIRDSVNFEKMTELYKNFQVFLNVNTITQSTTMMSRRVYELLASGTPIVSTPSKAVTEQFPGIVLTVRTEEEAKLAVNKLLTDSYFWHKQSVLGIREVLANHTYEDRWASMKSVINDQAGHARKVESIRVIAKYHGYQNIDSYIDTLLNQEGVKVVEIIIVKSSKLDLIIDNEIVKIVNLSEFVLEQYINTNVDISYTYLTQDTIYNYQKNLLGMLLSFKYSGSKAIVRSPYFKYSKLLVDFDFSVNNPNWYSVIESADLNTLLIKDIAIDSIAIDLINGKVKAPNRDLFLIDPFNILHLDDRKASVKDIENMVYKSNSKIGI
ncbi:glycosyltransferase [Ignatzschineria rhizosphaerae]|uniref:Glycosyltransferase n=1 Tax=Ignatzschineria rhizosphaerae TaxID=2923279 RepID=A0ABY3X9P1_9GAMM|nr:glycosyltransferase [Ignatzschineria rhizosphaerae]UNM97470.1 glycosyltransferase [Ignatzschineria rhizosphaerae]